MKTSSAHHRRRGLHCKRRARRIALIGLSIWFSQSLRAEISPALMEATKPLLEGVPEVAVVRLLALLDSSLADEEWCAVAAKLAEARVAARQPDRKSTRLNSSHRCISYAVFFTLSLHDALPIFVDLVFPVIARRNFAGTNGGNETVTGRSTGGRRCPSAGPARQQFGR